MIAKRGPAIIELDKFACEQGRPQGIITVDCSNPHEYDDGIAVEALPSAQELYKVSVFAVDGSDLYMQEDVLRGALKQTESIYQNERTALETYEPMLPTKLVQKKHFAKSKKPVGALCISFVTGEDYPPNNVEISFGEVEVTKNYNYKKFGEKCRYSPENHKFARASAYILHHLKRQHACVDTQLDEVIHVPKNETFRRGADINQSYMVAANFLTAKILQSEKALVIFRVHDPYDAELREIISPKLARFSDSPGRHIGLGLEVYTRVTSPLRRLEDLVMHGLLRARNEGRELDKRDARITRSAIQRLNQRIAASSFNGSLRMRDEDLWTLSVDEVMSELSNDQS